MYKAQTIILKDLKSKTNDIRQKSDLQWQLAISQNKLDLAKQILSDSVKISKETLMSLRTEGDCGLYTKPTHQYILEKT